MNKKKITIIATAIITVLIAIVIGFALPKDKSKPKGPDSPTIIEPVKAPTPRTYIYDAGDLVVKSGGEKINYIYNPSSATNKNANIAYEYIFGNPFDVVAAVSLLNIKTEDVKISYAYSTNRLNTNVAVTSETRFTNQTIAVGDDSFKYIYIIVSPNDEGEPVSFSTSLMWQFGRSTPVEVTTNFSITSVTSGVDSEIREVPLEPLAPEGYYFDAWFIDENYTKPANFPLIGNTKKLYARYANFPVDKLTKINNEYHINSAVECEGNVIVPTYYNNLPVTTINEGISTDASVILPCSITNIADNAFFDVVVNSVDLNSCVNLYHIGANAFVNSNAKIEGIEKCVAITEIGDQAFKSTRVDNVELDLSDWKINILSNWLMANMASYWNVTNVVLPNNITQIGEYALKNIEQTIEFNSNKIIKLYESAFNGYTKLTEISLSSAITEIPNNAFKGCVALESINLSACTGLTTIGNGAFAGCTSLVNITIPKNVTTIGDYAFDDCTNLSQVILSKELTNLGSFAFSNCSQLATITLPSNLIVIKTGTFKNSGLTFIAIPANIQVIENDAFKGCESLVEVGNLSSLNIVAGQTSNGYVAYNATLVHNSNLPND